MPNYTETVFRGLNYQAARQYAGRARTAAIKAGLAPPTWATSADAAAAPARAKPLEASATERRFTTAAQSGSALPAELREWAASSGGVAQLSADGAVQLFVWHQAQRSHARFESVDLAVDALRRDAVDWVPCSVRKESER